MRWNAAKNDVLETTRGVTFDAVVVAIGAGGLLDVIEHPNAARYSGQRVLVVAVDGYVHLVPFVEEREYLFLKTIIPSRKGTRDYLKRRLGRAESGRGHREAEDDGEGGGDADDAKGKRDG